MKLDRQSEQYAPTGNISGKGVERSLGTPNLDRLHILIREAVQNAWDARVSDEKPVRFRVRLRTLTAEQGKYLRQMFADLPDGSTTAKLISESLGTADICAIEIADYTTSGLAGPVRADLAPARGEAHDFANYFRNVGSPRDKHLGGGTYGYGKSAGFALSRCRTLIGYTQTTNAGKNVARLMAAAIGDPFEHRQKRFTGRHWWGVRARDGIVDPLQSEKALAAASSIGLEKRAVSQRGTTIMIIDPNMESRSLQQAANAVLECLAWFFWPKMLSRDNGTPAMRFEMELQGEILDMPDVSTFPPLSIFADSMKAAKGTSAKLIECQRPIRSLGRLGLARGRCLPRRALDTGREDPMIPLRCSHIALMRPAELVVRYHVGPALPSDLVEYGGVFVCNEDVEPDFAAAEPPAHDDWVPENLEGHSRTFVRVALRRLTETVERYANPLPPDGASGRQPSLAAIGDALGGVLLGQRGARTGMVREPQPPYTRTGSSRQPRSILISDPEPISFSIVRKVPCALFRVRFSGRGERPSVFRARPYVVLEGGSTPDAAGLPSPRVMGWLSSTGEQLSQTTELSIRVLADFAAIVAVSIPGDYAVGVEVRREGEG